MVFPADSSRKRLRCPFNLLLPLRYTHRAVRRTRNVSGSDAPFRYFGFSAHQLLAPPGNQPRHICARAIAEERLILELEQNEIMVTSNGLLRIFWPNGLPGTPTPGVIVGWRNSDYDLFVVTVLEDVEVGYSLRMERNSSDNASGS
jgi:hypothetical protein